ncbi:MAG: helix-turn-helix domain-containing protein [Candidatus Izimaplasma sp.]|nr:helix-turn-helix domain-containing protein [Candidatus Izimaplasma bacterium]
MPEKDIDYISIIDSLRLEKKLTVEDLCENIVNPRTYRRYLSGERKMSHEKIGEFCENLEITSSDLYFLTNRTERDEYVKVIKLYNLVNDQKYDEFYDGLKEIDKDKIIAKQNKKI